MLDLNDYLIILKKIYINYGNAILFKVSSAAWEEFEELQANYERELKLKEEAENFAHQVNDLMFRKTVKKS